MQAGETGTLIRWSVIMGREPDGFMEERIDSGDASAAIEPE